MSPLLEGSTHPRAASSPQRTAGIGLRAAHYAELLETGLPASTGIRWAEVITENFLDRGGRPRAVLERVRADVPIILHGVSLSLGGFDPIPSAFLRSLRALRAEIEASWISDHLCFGTHGGHYAHDLWPLPFTDECVRHVARRIRQVQDALGERIVIENISSYVEYQASTLSEHAFVRAVLEEADCDLLLDVNNLFVNAFNHGIDPLLYLHAIPIQRVRQMHVAGHLDCGDYLLDDHGREVAAGVWRLYRAASARFGEIPTIVEWDGEVPPLSRLLSEARRCDSERDSIHRVLELGS